MKKTLLSLALITLSSQTFAASYSFISNCDTLSGEYDNSLLVSIESEGNVVDPSKRTRAIFADGSSAYFYNDEVRENVEQAFYSDKYWNLTLCFSPDRERIVMVSTSVSRN